MGEEVESPHELPVGTRNRAAAGENRSPRIPIRAGSPGPRYVPQRIEDRCSKLVRVSMSTVPNSQNVGTTQMPIS